MKIFKSILLILFLLITLIYVTNITAIPNTIVLFKGEELNLGVIFGIYVKENDDNNYKTVKTSSVLNDIETVEKKTIELSLFNIIDIKEIEVNTIPQATVVPLGNTIGLKLYTTGVLVVGKTDIEGQKPYENSSIQEGDMIVAINETKITSTKDLVECVNECNGENLEIKYLRNGEEVQTNIEPVKISSDEYKLGLWVRDSAAGIGTITYYEPKTGQFAALRTWDCRY